jgi:uncharacterized protein YdeI (YjbR/CyaY-like superfamily)
MKDKKKQSNATADEFFHPGSRAEWRKWLEKNHEKKSRICLIKYKKHTGKPALTNLEAMHEAICFGWIDTTVRKLDEERYSQTFVKRNKNARWSKNTLSYGKMLIKEGKMTPAGLKMYKEGLAKPTNDHDIPKDASTPAELRNALKKAGVLEQFEHLAPSYRHTHIVWWSRAKQPETKQRRIEVIISQIKEKKKPGTLKD